jgi:putative endopeptidase
MRRLAVIMFVAACGSSSTPPAAPAPTPAPESAAPAPAPEQPVSTTPNKPVTTKTLAQIGLDPTLIDRSADPCTDFYQFACGGYIKKTEIPADKPMAMRSFIDIEDRNLDYEKKLLEQASTNPGSDPVMQKLGAFYGACMDLPTRTKLGLSPIQSQLSKVSSIHDLKSLVAALAWFHANAFDAVIPTGSAPDGVDANKMVLQIAQGGLGLRDRDYYVKEDDHIKKVRDAYKDYTIAMLVDAGRKPDQAAKQFDKIWELETAIAKVSKDKVELRDPKGTYNKIDRAGVQKLMPHVDWNAFLKEMGIPSVNDIVATSPDFLSGLDALLASTPIDVWKDYLTATVMRANADRLTPAIEDQRFAFVAKITGQQENDPQWKRCAAATDGGLGDLLGQAFVKDKFGGKSKEAAEEEIHAIRDAMKANLGSLVWMDAETKAKALAKLDAMTYQIGYPNKWKTYTFKVDKKTYAANTIAARNFENKRDLDKIGKPRDRDDWEMTPPTVNAYYSPTLNGMVFPAGILQPPFYSIDSSIPVNLGGMGMVVGHELTHGFDDQGSQFDAAGNLKDWWQPETEKQFKQRTKCVIDTYSSYKTEGMNLNGANTVGENIADIGGIKLALAAYRTLRAPAPDTVVADGFNEDQQFFLGFGQAWCSKSRADFAKMLVQQDEHSPSEWRVNGALSATPEFSRVWGCKVGSRMRPANACVVW